MKRADWSQVLALVLTLTLLVVAPATNAQQAEKLGKVTFAVSCTPAAQTEFNRAVALLHSFWFGAAAKGFAGVAL